MTLLVKLFRARVPSAGSILLEALIAFAALAVFALVAMNAASNSLVSQSGRADRYWQAEFAHSKAEEIAVTGLQDPPEGAEDGGWNWEATERRVWPDGKSRFDEDIALIELSLTVWASDHPDDRYTATTIIGRKP